MATEQSAGTWSTRSVSPNVPTAPSDSELLEAGVRHTCQRLAAAWSAGDVGALADALADDCDHMTLTRVRQVKRGRTALVESWMGAFARRSASFSARMAISVHSVRLLKTDLALVDGALEYTNNGIGPVGLTQGRSSQPFTAVMIREGANWLILSLRVGASSAAAKVITCSQDARPQ